MSRLESRGVPPGPIPARAGIGLRAVHHQALLDERPAVGWIEAHTENYFHEGGPAARALERARANYPLSLHGVGLGLGSADGIDREHLARVKRAIARFEPALVSEHACWGHAGGEFFNDLLPLPYTEEAVQVLARQVGIAQDSLGVRLLIENVSAYVTFEHSTLREWEFLAAVAATSGCGLLLDVNNVYVSSKNLGLDARAFILGLPLGSVGEIHLAGHARNGSILIDDHGSRVCEEVWQLYGQAIARFGAQPTLIEWDTDIPALATLVAESERADQILGELRGLAA
ncbi:MAG TPA: DUF692 domain-containing protein [Steroidobacteraceae bacterium]|jgi:uncharacterized protein (UPF0276 family)|nr:DUF692 domain-containing protein [Steroidobacteraceae bacterium]